MGSPSSAAWTTTIAIMTAPSAVCGPAPHGSAVAVASAIATQISGVVSGSAVITPETALTTAAMVQPTSA
jgi:hypothetical protein